MKKTLDLIVQIASIIGLLLLILAKLNYVNSSLWYVPLGVSLICKPIIELYEYKETKKKTHLIIPVLFLSLLAAIIVLKIF